MKFYLELDGNRQFIIEADAPVEAIAALWERRADTCRDLDDILPEYWIHCGVARLGGSHEAWGAFWLLTPSARFAIRHVLKSQLCEQTYQDACQLLLEHLPEEA